ncbi:hypothetical protein [Halosegnis sp.]|uniref:hypothetical protein n=1 Tax=Halosegnis sp. TaxID=2864959 RepID=UPI0035D4E7A8
MVTVSYHCPRCEAVARLERDPYLADRCVTPDPLNGWEYVPAYELDGETDPQERADGVELVCGAAETDGEGCGEPYYLSFVAFDEGNRREPPGRSVDANFEFLRQ